MSEPIVRRYFVDICDPCMKLEPSECHTPGCIFWLCHMPEVSVYLNQMLIRPIVDGEQMENLQPHAEILSDEAGLPAVDPKATERPHQPTAQAGKEKA